MPDTPRLVPVFVPSLAVMLASAERNRSSPLGAAEVLAVRDIAACIMMTAIDAEKMDESRGYRDVNPENAWVDWHRLRPQFCGGYLPKIVLCVPGGDDFRNTCEPVLSEAGVEYEFHSNDPNLARAFKAGSMTWQSLNAESLAKIGSHTTVLYALSKNVPPADAAETARSMLSLGRRLLDAGGFAIKCESSGIAHPSTLWAMLDDRAEIEIASRWSALFRAYVVYPIGAEELCSCGMQLLGAPDLIIATSILRSMTPGKSNIDVGVSSLFAAFALYLLNECPPGTFASGHTFSEMKDALRFRMVWEPCSGYDESDLFFNPFGRWRFTAP